MTKALTITELNAMGCGNPNCRDDHSILYMHSGCHPGAGLDVAYSKPTGTMHLICRECEDTVLCVKVAD
jgi:hypothetical protein